MSPPPHSLLLAALLFPLVLRAAEPRPPLWGMGVRTCPAFVAAWDRRDEAGRGGEAARYRDWLAGFVSGLDLALGKDVLRGHPLAATLARIHVHCDAHPEQDFFNATMMVIRGLHRAGAPAASSREK